MKRYWKVWVSKQLWKNVDRQRKKDKLKWTQLIEKLFLRYLADAIFYGNKKSALNNPGFIFELDEQSVLEKKMGAVQSRLSRNRKK